MFVDNASFFYRNLYFKHLSYFMHCAIMLIGSVYIYCVSCAHVFKRILKLGGMFMKSWKKLISGFLACSMVLSLMSWNTSAATTFEIEAENYVSSSGAFNTLKASQASGGKYLGDFKTNHCASYELEIEKAGNYEVLVSVGTINKGGIVMANCNGSFSEEATVPNTGAWQTYQNVALKVWMETGTQILTISNLNGTWNFDKISVNYVDSEVETAD